MDLPIACTLSAAELEERKSTILNSVRSAVLGRTPVPQGYRYEFSNCGATSQEIRRLVELERQCCQFLSFNVTENENTIRLDVIGQPAALAVIEDLFG
jgi:hypothetical protein